MQTRKSFPLQFVCVKFQSTSIKSFVSHIVRLNLKSEQKLKKQDGQLFMSKEPYSKLNIITTGPCQDLIVIYDSNYTNHLPKLLKVCI